MRRRLLRILPFLAVLLLAVFTAAVLAPSAMTKKQPPPAPSGVFTVQPYGSIALTGMTLTSDHLITAAVVWWYPDGTLAGFELLGDNSAAPGEEVALPDLTSGDWPGSVPITVRLLLVDETADTGYTSDTSDIPVNFGDANFSSVPGHATVGWVDAQVLVSINDGSVNPQTESKPDLGAGNFNATVEVTAPPAWPVTITNITGYSDGPTVEGTTPMCGFHAVITYTGKTAKKATVWAQTMLIAAKGFDGLGQAEADLTASPVNPGMFNVRPENLIAGTDYQFIARIGDNQSNLLGIQFGSVFTLDPTTFVGVCPAEGEIISTNFGS